MEINQAIEISNNKLLPVLETMFWKGQKDHPEKQELLEWLPFELQIYYEYNKNPKLNEDFGRGEQDRSLPNTLAQMLIYLIENNLIKPESLGKE